MIGTGERQFAAARALLFGLRQAGVKDAVISPGSRSTPLVLAAEAVGLRLNDVIDERCAAFFALGQARVTGRPSVLIATSGTAGAHHLPAAIEASASFVPLISLTADRPHELQSCGALQTIDQGALFGRYARGVHEIDLAADVPDLGRALASIGAQAVHEAMHPVPGPVHVNVKARKPLESRGASPEVGSGPDRMYGGAQDVRRESSSPVPPGAERAPRIFSPEAAPSKEAIEEIAQLILRSRRGLLIAGPGAVDASDPSRIDSGRASILDLVRATGFVLMAESTSQLRFLSRAAVLDLPVCDRFDALFRAESARRAFVPDLIIQLGAWPTSSGLDAFIAAHRHVPRIVISPHGLPDPDRSAAMILAAPAAAAAELLTAALGRAGSAPAVDREWTSALVEASARAARTIARAAAEDAGAPLREGDAVRHVVRMAPQRSYLIAGNGLAIRHLDTFCGSAESDLIVLSQRGTSGIDGLVSGAAGAASLSDRPVTLLLGDISLLHDLGGLMAARRVPRPLVLVALHNDGGRIFEQLPIAAEGRADAGVLAHFLTPHGLSFAPAAELFGLAYSRASNPRELGPALEGAYRRETCTLIEARVGPQEAASTYARIWRDVAHEENA